MWKVLLTIMIGIAATGGALAAGADIAAAAAGMVIYGSEYAPGNDWGQLLNGSGKPYRSLPGRQRRDVVLDWRKIVRVEAVVLEYAGPPDGTVALEYWSAAPETFRPVPGVRQKLENRRLELNFPPLETSRLRLTFTPENSAEPLSVSRIAVTGDTMEPPASNWAGVWIWGEDGDRKVEFRRQFAVDDPKQLKGAWVQAAADDLVELELNGVKVGPASFRMPGLFDLAGMLRPGANELRARAVDSGGAFGFLGEIILDRPEGCEVIATGPDWQYRRAESSDDWQAARRKHNSPPDCPWGEIRHINPLRQEAVCAITGVTVPGEITPGSVLAGKIRLRFDRQPTEKLWLTLRLSGGIQGNRDLDVAQCSVAVPESGVTAGVELPFAMYIGEFAPDGDLPLTVMLTGKRSCRLEYDGKSSADAASALAVARIAIRRLPEKPPVAIRSLEVRTNGDSPTLYVNGEAVPLVIQTNFNSGYRTMHEYSKTDSRIYRIAALEGQIITAPELQNAALAKAFAALEANVGTILRYRPDALLILSTLLRTTPEWAAYYPGESALRSDGLRSVHQSAASTQWRRDAASCVKALVEFVESRPWGRQVIGYTFLTGGGGEFHHYIAGGGLVPRDAFQVSGYSDAARNGFRAYLREVYGTEAALRRAWNDPAVTFETAGITRDMITAPPGLGYFSDPATQRARLDYFDFYSSTNAENLLAACRAVKQYARFPVLAGGYLGYWFNTCMQYPGGAQESGAAGFIDVIARPEVDFISLPYAYFNRQTGTAPFSGILQDSLRIRNKLSFHEFDMRTHIANIDAAAYGQRSLAEAVEVMKRDIGYALCQGPGFGWWWLDFSGGRKGQNSIPWYDDPALIGLMKQAVKMAAEAAAKPFVNRSEIALFYDMRSSYRLDYFASIPAYNTVYSAIINAVSAIGAPVDLYDLRDIGREEVQRKYRMYIFPNAYLLSPEQRRIIREKLQIDGKMLVWLWAPGFLELGGSGTAAMTEVTGFHFAMATAPRKPLIELKPASFLVKGAGIALEMGDWHISHFRNRDIYGKLLAPSFSVTDSDCEVAGNYAETGEPALVYKDFGRFQSIFCGIPNWHPAILRNAARKAGVHIYCDGAVVSVAAGGDYVMLHNRLRITNSTLCLPRKCDIFDAFSGELLARQSDRLPVRLAAGETRVFKLR